MSAAASVDNRDARTSQPGAPTDLRQAIEPMELDEGGDREVSITYPTGIKLWLNIAAIMTVAIMKGLDLTIVAVTVPSLTDHFKTANDIGWYSAAYGLCVSAFTFFFGRLYVVFPLKSVFLTSILVFAVGSLCSTLAPTSKAFILGRALAGFGAGGFGNGMTTIISYLFPLQKRPLWFGIIGGVQTVALVCAPLIGGVLINSLSWRACFGINLPFSGMALLTIYFGFQDPTSRSTEEGLGTWVKLKSLNFVGTAIIVPCITCLLLALQWGGTRYGWDNHIIISLLVLFGVLCLVFVAYQHKFPNEALIPARILKNRSIIGGAWFEACCDGSLAVTEYYISIYFQGVRGFTPTKSGLLGIPMIVGLLIASIIAGVGTSKFGYYTPFMFATAILAPVPAGILTALDPEEDLIKSLCCIGALGAAIGLGISAPQSACQTTLSLQDVPLGNAILLFGAGMGSSVFVLASAALFQNQLDQELGFLLQTSNMTSLDSVGLTDIRGMVSPDKLQEALLGYNTAVARTLYLPLALTILSILGSAATEWRSVKKKED